MTRYVNHSCFLIADILHATVFGRHFMVLNSLEDAEELLERRARNYSDRPTDPIVKV